MIRNYEGTTRLQGIGVVGGITAKNIKVGDVLVWNFGSTSKVVSIEFSKTGKTLKVTTEHNGELYERRFNAERIVVVKELNPVEEVKTVEDEIEELSEVQTQIEKAENTEERYRLRDIENQLKWEIWSMIDLLTEKREEVEVEQEQEKEASSQFESWLNATIEEQELNYI